VQRVSQPESTQLSTHYQSTRLKIRKSAENATQETQSILLHAEKENADTLLN